MREVLALLGLEGSRFSIAVKSEEGFFPRCFDDAASAEAWLESTPGDVYICGNPIREGVSGKPTNEDVFEARWQLCDVDPKGDEDLPAIVAAEVFEAIDQRGALIDSGRGSQVWARVDPDVDRAGLGAFFKSFERPGCEVDATHDPSRLMRMPGSINSRTGRSAIVLNPGEDTRIAAGEVDPAPTPEVSASFDPSPPSASDLAWLAGPAQRIWTTPPETDRSTRDFLFVRELLSAGVPEDVACRLTYALPFGKHAEDERKEAYWQSTVKSVFRTLQEEGARRERLEGLLSEAEADAGYVFSEEVLLDLAWLQRSDAPRWQRLRKELKGLRSFKLSDLDQAISKAGAEALGPPDAIVRCILRGGAELFWLLADDVGGWKRVKAATVQSALRNIGGDDARTIAVKRGWELVSVPFERLWLDGRRYNASLAQWRVAPLAGAHAMWTQLLRVVGRGLDPAVLLDPWCKRCGLRSGAEYIFAWLACLAQHPADRVAYLFCFSKQQNIGKSMLNKAISKHLLSGGVVDAGRALVGERGFNAELEGAVLCTVEEVNLGRARQTVHQRQKVYVTEDEFPSEGKGANVLMRPNYTHWYQTSNEASFCPLFAGDTRVTAWEMLPPLQSEVLDSWEIHRRLAAEAPAFLHTLLGWPVPEGGDGRLRIPAVGTEAKAWQQQASTGLLEVWTEKHPAWVALEDEELTETVQRWLQARGENLRYWRTNTILQGLPCDVRTLELKKIAKGLREIRDGSSDGWHSVEALYSRLAVTAAVTSKQHLGGVIAELVKRGVKWLEQRRSAAERGVYISPGRTVTTVTKCHNDGMTADRG